MDNRYKLIILFCLITNVISAQTNSWLGKTKGKLPMLAYGEGGDRLGGAKMGFIDTNVLVKVIDSTKDMYKLQLSQFHTAFIGKEFIEADSIIKQKPFYLTNSWMVKGTDTCYDIVQISVDEKLPYKSWMEINPSKIVVDIYGVQSNTNWITQLQNTTTVKNVYYHQIENDVVRATIELINPQHWGYSIGYDNKRLTLKIKRQPNLLLPKQLKIAIDAGHGGSNTGAGGVNTGIAEKEYTLLFAKAFEKQLKLMGYKNIFLTRNTDTNITNTDRVLLLQQYNPDILLSFHLNSSSKKEVSGNSTYYKHIGFKQLSKSIIKKILANTALSEFGNIGSFNFMLNAPTDFVNCLVEVAFLSNPSDEQKILDKKFHTQIAKQVAAGMLDFIDIAKKQTITTTPVKKANKKTK
jgi:N-acetylmuramoyl-L-alanine amidase